MFRDQLLRFSDTQYRDRWENAIRKYRVQGDPDFDGENNEAVDFYQKAVISFIYTLPGLLFKLARLLWNRSTIRLGRVEW